MVGATKPSAEGSRDGTSQSSEGGGLRTHHDELALPVRRRGDRIDCKQCADCPIEGEEVLARDGAVGGRAVVVPLDPRQSIRGVVLPSCTLGRALDGPFQALVIFGRGRGGVTRRREPRGGKPAAREHVRDEEHLHDKLDDAQGAQADLELFL